MPSGGRAILLTPPGGAAIAVVRLSGPGVAGFLSRHFSRAAKPGRAVHGELSDGDRVLDDPVVVAHPGRAAADLNLHGGPWVVRSVLGLARREGFAPAAPAPGGPAPQAAVDGASKSEREMLRHLPRARSELGVRVLLAQPEAWERFEPTLRAAEAGADAAQREAASARVRRVLYDRSLYWLLHPPRVAVVGAANVGKSTLANQLFARDRSITADAPGTTRDWVGEIADVNGLPVMLVDTPGLRATDDLIEVAAIERAGEQVAAADLVVLVLDATRLEEAEQVPLPARYPGAIRVVNKCDQLPADGCDAVAGAIHTTATTGRGVELLRAAIAARFGCDAMEINRPRWWTEAQQRLLAARTSGHGPAGA